MTQLTAACWSFRRTPLEILALMPRGDALPSAATQVMERCGAAGVVVLSTCNRFELYLDSAGPLALHDVAAAVAEAGGGAPEVIAAQMDLLTGSDVVHHLFSVAAGLDSRIVREEEVLGQVRAATAVAATADTGTAALTALFHWAIRAGRRARRAAPLPRRRSAAVQAVEALGRLLPELDGRRVLVVGTGRMARGAIRSLAAAGAAVVVSGRSAGSKLAGYDGQVMPLSQLPSLLSAVDAVICATSAPTPLLTTEMLRQTIAARVSRLPIVDLGVPANVDHACRRLAGVALLDLDTLADGGENDPVPADEMRRAAAVVSEEVRSFLQSQRSRDVGRLVISVTERAETVRAAELARVAGRAGEAQPLLEEVTRRLVNKLVHDIVVGVRQRFAVGDMEGALAIARALGEQADSEELPIVDCA
jgi:glutamyl-tRNA reductase